MEHATCTLDGDSPRDLAEHFHDLAGDRGRLAQWRAYRAARMMAREAEFGGRALWHHYHQGQRVR